MIVHSIDQISALFYLFTIVWIMICKNFKVAVFGIFQNPSDESAIGLGASQIFASGSPPVFLASYGLFRLNLFSENMVSSLTATRVRNVYCAFTVAFIVR